MKNSDKIVPILIGIVMVLLVIFCVFFVELPEDINSEEEGGLVRVSNTEKTNVSSTTIFGMLQNAVLPNETKWVNAAQEDNAKLVSLIKKNALPINNLATICMIHINNNNAAELKKQAQVLEKTVIAAWDETDPLKVSAGEYSLMYEGYRSALTEYMMAASVLKMGVPSTTDEKKTAYGRLTSASNRMIDAYNDIDFEVEYPDDISILVRGIEAAEPEPEPEIVIEPLVIPGALSLGENYLYMDAKQNNRISVTIPDGSSRLLRSFYYTDKSTGNDVTLTAPDGKFYYMVTVSYTHAGHVSGTAQTVTPPAANAHILKYEDKALQPISITSAIGNGLNVGLAYNTAPINRLETQRMLLFYEVPTDFTREDAYMTINLGATWGTPAWKLW